MFIEYRILIIRDTGSGKTNALLNLINHKPDIDKIYLYSKDPYKAIYQLKTDKRTIIGLTYFNHSNEFLNDIDNMYKTIEEHNPNKKQKNIDCIR